MDATLSINRKYYSFVIPRIVSFYNKHEDINSLKKLHSKIKSVGFDDFCTYWNYNHIARVKLLYELSNFFLELCEHSNKSELLTMQEWANNTTVENYKDFPVSGIGLATFQYLRILLGASTVKPDVHIKKAISLALNKKVTDIYSISLIENVSLELNKDASQVDYFIWGLYADKGEKPPYIWKNGFWGEDHKELQPLSNKTLIKCNNMI